MASNTANRTSDDVSNKSHLPFLESECIPWVVVLIGECMAIVILNVITIIVFVKKLQLRRRSTYLIIHLAIVDLLVGAVSGPLFIYWFGSYCGLWEINAASSLALRNTFQRFPLASLLNLAAISLERAHATFCPFKHRFIKKWVYGVIIIVLWLTNTTAGLIKGAIVHFCRSLPRHGAVAARERKLTSILFIVTLASLCMWFPSVIQTGIYILRPQLLDNSFWGLHYQNIMVALFQANSLVNPIIYAMKMPELRKDIMQIIFRQTVNRLYPVDLPLCNL
ncbi:D(2) dopamine receptor-like [Stylophora pistillata]|uniref:D(2) dopamine receptor-like n=1 Tax=Stylophora pistillata TaxID=50429 RepID=UPI000C048F79|nr:D(2) dopamine receptor-like [Stylophora pistillata]